MHTSARVVNPITLIRRLYLKVKALTCRVSGPREWQSGDLHSCRTFAVLALLALGDFGLGLRLGSIFFFAAGWVDAGPVHSACVRASKEEVGVESRV